MELLESEVLKNRVRSSGVISSEEQSQKFWSSKKVCKESEVLKNKAKGRESEVLNTSHCSEVLDISPQDLLFDLNGYATLHFWYKFGFN